MNTIENNEMKDSLTPQQERLDVLKRLMPEIFDEGKIDFEKLKATLGENITFSNERYVLNWAGKSDAFRIMQRPSSATLVPCKEESVDFDTFSKSDFRAVKVKDCFAVPKSKKLLQFTLDDGTGTDRTILSGIHAFYEPEQLIGKTLVAITNLPPRKMMGVESCGMLLSALHTVNGEEKLNLLMVDDHIPAGAKLY